MEKKLSTQAEKELDWLKNEIEKDKIELDKEKKEFIESMKGLKKEEIVKKEEQEELNTWKRIRKVILGY
jgi:hypothetical protein